MKRATVRTRHDDPAAIAAAVVPDNTPEMDTRVADGSLVTTVERETTGGLQSTVDDYVANLAVAAETARLGADASTHERNDEDTHQS